jgi:hypothetical protein
MKILNVIVVTGMLIVANGCGPGEKAVNQDGTRAMLQAEAQSISASDADAIATFIELPGRWNRSAAPLVRDYLDPNVPADRWVKEASTHIGELRAVWLEMHACTFGIQDPGIKGTFEELSSNYKVKLDYVTALHSAVAQGDHLAEQDAQQGLSEANAEGQRLAQGLLDRLRPFAGPQDITDELRKRGKEIGELMKPR